MEKKDIKVLIVEDDQSLSKVLTEAISRAGYGVHSVTKPEDALSAFKVQPFQVVIADCMLPQMNGVQLCEKLRDSEGNDFHIILMSGIFKDKVFIKDSLKSAKAQDFLTKPFNVQEVLQKIDAAVKDKLSPQMEPLHELLTKDNLSNHEKLGALLKATNIHGFELPLIYTLLLEAKISGHLIMIYAEGHVGGVTFCNGRIVQVNSKENSSYFGILLVEKGYITKDELDKVLAIPSNKKIGEKLVHENYLSPHAVHIVQTEQMLIRLASTIEETAIEINFIPCDTPNEEVFIDSNILIGGVCDWITSKLSLSWLKSFYTPWMEHHIVATQELERIKSMVTLPLVVQGNELILMLSESRPLHVLFEHFEKKHAEETFYRTLHFLLIQAAVRFEVKEAKRDYDAFLRRLKKLSSEFSMKNAFEILGVSEKAKDREIQKAFNELAQVLDPKNLGADAPPEARELCKGVFLSVKQSFEQVSSEERRAAYAKSLELGFADQMIRNEAKYEEGKALLAQGQYQKAYERLAEIAKLGKSPPSGLRTYLIWCRIKLGFKGSTLDKFIKELDFDFSQIPPEERHNAHFFYVRGLYYSLSNNLEKAMSHWEKASALDPNFLDPKREIASRKKANEKTNILQKDLKDVVGMFFGKKK